MMKKFLFIILAATLWLAGTACARAQGKTTLQIIGKDKGSVASIQANGVTYLDVQKTAKKLGANVELYAAAKQAKVTLKGFSAILTAGESSVVVNGSQVALGENVIAYKGDIMAPVTFFMLPSLQKALDRQIEFKDNILWVEKNFNLAYEDKVQTAKGDQLIFFHSGPVQQALRTVNKHTVEVTFPRAVVKRELSMRLKDDYIQSFNLREEEDKAVLRVVLGRKAKNWSLEEAGDKWVLRVAQNAADMQPEAEAPSLREGPKISSSAPAQTKPAFLLPAPSVIGEEEEEETPAASAPAQAAPAAKAPAKENKDLKPAIVQPAPAQAHKKMRIMVDPGHGGKDPGALRRGYREKTWNLAVAKELAALLKKGGFEVRMTRDNDKFIALSERSKMANNFKADLFVSIHTNASKNSRANGFQVYFRSEKATDKEAAEVAALENEALQYEEVHYNFVDALLQSLAKNEYINESSKLAGYVRNAVYKQPGIGIAVNRNSSVRQANFYVLKGVNSPAILVEMGYISSSKDRARLSQKTVQKRMALAIYKGIFDYAKKEGWLK